MSGTFFRIFIAFVFVIGCLAGCGKAPDAVPEVNVCGGNAGTDKLNGLAWLAGTPTQANVLCGIQQSKAKVLLSLDPDSRDPLLFRDVQTGWQLLVERFSGRQARSSRLTWFSTDGQRLGQRGDWPRNVYGINVLSTGDALVTGFDSRTVQRVLWNPSDFAQPIADAYMQLKEDAAHPIHTLSNGAWSATVDSGYDLIRFSPTNSKIHVYQKDSVHSQVTREIKDDATGTACLNAFQTYSISASEVLLSCNPQYFGPTANQRLAVFRIVLESDGAVLVRSLVEFDGLDIQRVDIWGFDSALRRILVAYKKTTIDDYEGTLAKAMWMSLDGQESKQELRFAGHLKALPAQGYALVACSENLGECRKGRFLLVQGATPSSDSEQIQLLDLQPVLPFFSFATELSSK